MEKIKILSVPSDLHGVGSYRNIWPSQMIQKNHSDEFFVEINAAPQVETNNWTNLSYLKQFDIIHFHRSLGPHEMQKQIFSELKAAGVSLVVDIDDYWDPPMTHPLYEIVRRDKINQKIKETVQAAEFVTTTTDIFASYIKNINKNVYIIPNAVDTELKMWKSEDTKLTDKVRIAWIGGSSHLHDLENLRPSFKALFEDKEIEGKFQLILCGFDTRGSMTMIKPDGTKEVRKILPHESIWVKFEEIFTDNYKLVNKDEDYLKWLKKIKNEDYDGLYQKPYVRRWTLPLQKYAIHYDYCDICLAPLQEKEDFKLSDGKMVKRTHIFNEVKSELKIIESGMKNKALIAQNFGIYKHLLKNEENGLLVDSNDKLGWYKAIKKLILNPDLRKKISDNLSNYVKSEYDLEKVTERRVEVYRSIIQSKKEKTAAKV